MRDLASRLRAIVHEGKRPRSGLSGEGHVDEIPSLTYVPDSDATGVIDAGQVAHQLGGRVRRGASGAFVEVDRVWDATDFHGPRRLSSYALGPDAPIALFDPRLAAVPTWAERPIFFDIETTGLSGGAGTIAFLAGCGWFEGGGFRVRQFLLTGPAGESDMLAALGEVFDEASLLVTYNGRTFDVPTMETRWAFHRRQSPVGDLPHFDMLPAARRLWARRQPRHDAVMPRVGAFAIPPAGTDPAGSCSLTSLERSVLGFHRRDDVPGFEIPGRYFQFLRSGDAAPVRGVLEHNQFDLVSLAAVTAHALDLVAAGPDTCRLPIEQVGLGRLYERAGDLPRAQRAFEMAGASDDPESAGEALSRLAVLCRRADRHDEAAAAWQRVMELAGARPGLRALARRAAEALAIHHEHRAGDPTTARDYAERLRHEASGRSVEDVRHRLARLDRKIRSGKDNKGGREAAQLFES